MALCSELISYWSEFSEVAGKAGIWLVLECLFKRLKWGFIEWKFADMLLCK